MDSDSEEDSVLEEDSGGVASGGVASGGVATGGVASAEVLEVLAEDLGFSAEVFLESCLLLMYLHFLTVNKYV